MTEQTTPQAESPEASQLPEEHTPGTSLPRRLERIEEGKWIAGVATGLAEYFSVPAWLIRLIFIFLLAPAGLGVLTYLALVVFMPHESEEESPAERWFGTINNPERAIGVGLAVIAALVLIGSVAQLDGGVIVALALLAVGVMLYQGGSFGGPRSDADDGENVDGGGTPPRPPRHRQPRQPREPKPPKAPRPPRPKSNLGAYTFAAIFIAVGLLASFDIAGILDPVAFHYVATTMSVIGLGLVVGAWRGRARGLILLGFALLPILGITWLTSNVNTIVAEWQQFTAAEDVHDNDLYAIEAVAGTERLDFGVGQVTVDLSDTEFEASADLRIRMDAGQLTVIVPDDVRVRANVDLGEIDRPGPNADGIDVTAFYGPTDATAFVTINLDVGQVVIEEGN